MRNEKYDALGKLLLRYGSAAVAFSGGVDSTFLLTAAREVLGENAFAIFADSPVVMEQERKECLAFCREKGRRLIRLTVTAEEMETSWENSPERCYYCKRLLFFKMKEAAGDAVLAEGTNVDDLSDYRPGIRALRELGIQSPLLAAGYTKEEIRRELRERNLKVWEKPAYACLASRIPYGEMITEDKLRKIDRAEQGLRSLGFRQLRVRCLERGTKGLEARVEVLPEAVERLREAACFSEAEKIVREAGFSALSVDPKGYRRGSLNRGLETIRAAD